MWTRARGETRAKKRNARNRTGLYKKKEHERVRTKVNPKTHNNESMTPSAERESDSHKQAKAVVSLAKITRT